jgi:hypothetical protein
MNDSTLASQQPEAVSSGYPDLNSLIETLRDAAAAPPSQRKSFRIQARAATTFLVKASRVSL